MTSLAGSRASPAGERGFSLIEVLIMLAILSGMAGIAVTSATRSIARAESRALERTVKVLVDDARFMSLSHARTVKLSEYAAVFAARQDDAGLDFQGEVVIWPGGVCESGRGRLGKGGHSADFRVKGLDCVVEIMR